MALTKLHRYTVSKFAKNLESSPSTNKFYYLIFFLIYMGKCDRKKERKTPSELEKNMEVMKKKPPNKDSINKRINTKTRLKVKFT